jgi:hypothetical protein
MFISGKGCIDFNPFLTGANLFALNKKITGIRPVAVGETPRRLFAKCICSATNSEAKGYLQPFQLGVATPNACEQVIHKVRKAFDEHGEGNNYVMLKIDFSNAFNTVNRPVFLTRL